MQNDNTSRHFFSFFENFNFLGQTWGKGPKMAQNWQKACLHSIRGTTCDMIVLFSMFVIFNIFSASQAFFHFLKILILGQKCDKRAKIGQE